MKNLVISALTFALVAGMMAAQSLQRETEYCEAPKVALCDMPGYETEEQEISEAERTILPADTTITKRLYRASDGGSWHMVTLVIGGHSKSSIHRPELCLPSQGFHMMRPRTVDLGTSVWRLITLDGGGTRPSLGFAYTFFNQDGFRTSSHMRRIFQDVWDRSVLARIDRWAMVTVNSSEVGDAEVAAFLRPLMERMLK